ncbi:hypothetical protein [Nocardia bovistercoris]|uniref:Uncharacterized protein n=1 Tax=Nocardia bovistercoris TaxID=2785916 RepID=A0A931N567_9NOCA|nr:hypothetical protein [Nocardia bovistercoris]MBH0778343.1 hypothetical protein [Nocardia bovistercoris]
MRFMTAKFGIGLTVAAAAVVFSAGPVAAEPNDLSTRASAEQVLLPESGSAGVYNNLMCWLHTISADVPCMWT